MKRGSYERKVQSRWFRVERGIPCAIGSHPMAWGIWARWTVRHDGTADCADCLEALHGIVRPEREAVR